MIDNKKLEEILEESIELMKKKNADYSSENILIEGSRGVVTRLLDKTFRLKNLLSKPESEINFESVLDTFMDITNYGIIGQLLEKDGWKGDQVLIGIVNKKPQGNSDTEWYLRSQGRYFSWLQDIVGGQEYSEVHRMAREAILELSEVILITDDIGIEESAIIESAKLKGKRICSLVRIPGTEYFKSIEEFNERI